METGLGVLKVAYNFLLQKPLTKDTAQMALFLVIYESVTAKIAFFCATI